MSREWKVGDSVGLQNPNGGPFVERQVSEVWTWRDGSKSFRLGSLDTLAQQSVWEKHGWRLYRKASNLPFTPQQMADFQAVMELIDDRVGTNGEGQS